MPTHPLRGFVSIAVCVAAISAAAAAQTTQPVNRTDANGNPIRVAARTGHVSNYDEAKVGNYALPDPLVLADGKPVSDAATWFNLRRPEILNYYENDIYGRVPLTAPAATFELVSTDPYYLNGNAVRKQIVMHLGGPGGMKVPFTLVIPTGVAKPPPVILAINFNFGALFGGRGRGLPGAAGRAGGPGRAGAAATQPAPPGINSPQLFLSHGYAYANIYYTDVQADRANASNTGVQKLAMLPGQTALAPDDWSTITCWAWGMSRVMDYLETDPAVDAKRVAIQGMSRLGKTVLVAGAMDPRFSLIFSCCGGEMGSSLGRRDFGETIDDIAQNYPWQFAGNLQKFIGHWDDMPVDTHMLISLCAPRPVLITGGVLDQWSDPHGEFLAEVAAGPVYRLLGAKDIGATEMPKPDSPVITGDLAFHYHHEGHTVTLTDWNAFFAFADRYLKPVPPAAPPGL